MTGYKKINMETWARREHYEYYTKQLKVEYNITANVDVKNVLDFCHSKGYKFYPAMIYLVTKTLNRIENFKMLKINMISLRLGQNHSKLYHFS